MNFFLLKYRRIAYYFILFISIYYVAFPLLQKGIFLSQDELILNYWSWRCDLNNLFHFLPTAKHDDRPTGWLAINLIYELFGANHRMQLVSILIIHWVNSLFVFRIAQKILKVEFISFLCAFLFACLYPANSAILYIGAIFDIMCGFFILLSFIMFIEYASVPSKAFSVLCYFIALRAKEMAFAMPFVLAFYYLATECLEVSLKSIFKIVKQIWPFLMVLVLIAVIYVKVGKVGGKILPSTHPYFMEFDFRTFYRLINHYMSRLSWIPEQFHPASLLAIIAITGIIFRQKILLATIFSLIAILTPVLFYPNHIFDLYMYTPSIFFAILVGSLLKIMYVFSNNFMRLEMVNTRRLIKLVIIASVVVLTSASVHSREYQEKMRGELAIRKPLAILASTILLKYSAVKNNSTFYISGLPNVGVNQGPNWPEITHLIRIVCRNKTLNAVTDNVAHNIKDKYIADKGSKIFLTWHNGHFSNEE